MARRPPLDARVALAAAQQVVYARNDSKRQRHTDAGDAAEVPASAGADGEPQGSKTATTPKGRRKRRAPRAPA